jgi:SAM-dependent MidA family methyltransferase
MSINPQVLAALSQRLKPGSTAMPLDDYIDCVLYHPEAGYYMRDHDRVGHREGTDFYTASSMGELFTRLVLGAIGELINADLKEFSFVEAGPESPLGILESVKEIPFKEHIQIRPGEAFAIPEKAIVFSNELFDAQPFKRFIRTGDRWMEAGVSVTENAIGWCLLKPASIPENLPRLAPEGYTVDWPGRAHDLLEKISSQSWQGLFLAFDYGLDRSIVLTQRPEGTGRTYFQHTMSNDLLQNPGFSDITCHVIWDELEKVLRSHHFTGIQLMRQEAFFMHLAQPVIQAVMESSPAGFSPDKQTLMELLHPGNMGHKFQVLHALRME